MAPASGTVDVKAVESLDQLAQSFQQFAQSAGEIPNALGRQLQQVTTDLEYRQQQNQSNMRKAEYALRTAKQELRTCQSKVIRDRDGRRQKPDCRRKKSAVDAASRNVHHAQRNLDEIQRASNKLREAGTLLQTSSAKLRNLMEQEVQRAVAVLHKHSDQLERYQNSQAGGAGIGPSIIRSAGEVVETLKEAVSRGEMSDENIRTLVNEFTRGSGDRVVLGPYGKNGYIAEARKNGGIYFDTGKEIWSKLNSGDLSGTISTWLLNRQFLIDQLETGIPIFIHGAPAWDLDKHFWSEMEIGFLNRVAKDYGYKFSWDKNAWTRNLP